VSALVELAIDLAGAFSTERSSKSTMMRMYSNVLSPVNGFGFRLRAFAEH